jgi:hypothetical protein
MDGEEFCPELLCDGTRYLDYWVGTVLTTSSVTNEKNTIPSSKQTNPELRLRRILVGVDYVISASILIANFLQTAWARSLSGRALRECPLPLRSLLKFITQSDDVEQAHGVAISRATGIRPPGIPRTSSVRPAKPCSCSASWPCLLPIR